MAARPQNARPARPSSRLCVARTLAPVSRDPPVIPPSKKHIYLHQFGAVASFLSLAGDEKRAEVVSSKAFLSFYRESTRLPVADGIPSRLVGLAYSAMQPCRAERSVRTNDPSLENCILLLDCRQRAVFIMRNVLRMSWPTVAGASGSSVEDAKESWPTANARY